MVLASLSLREDYWEDFELLEEDIDFLYSHLIEVETPLTPQELLTALVEDRIQREIREIEEKTSFGGRSLLPSRALRARAKGCVPGARLATGRSNGDTPRI